MRCYILNYVLIIGSYLCFISDAFGADLRAEDNPCQGRPNASYQRHPLGCKYFIMCMNNNVNSGACPAGLAFNPDKPPCDLAANVGCTDEIVTSPRPPRTTTTTTTIRPTTRAPTTTTTTTSTTTPVPTTTTTTTTVAPTTTTTTTAEPSATTTTSSTTTTTTTTPMTTTTNEPTTTTTVAPSTTTATPTTTPIVRPSIPALPPFVPPPVTEPLISCPFEEDPMTVRFVSSNEDCAKYYICYHNQPMAMSCSTGLHWNHRTQKCDLQERAECFLEPMPSSFPVCPRDSVGLYPHPFRCEQFLYCFHGHMTVQQCKFFYHWDIDTQACQLQTLAHCGSQTANTSPMEMIGEGGNDSGGGGGWMTLADIMRRSNGNAII